MATYREYRSTFSAPKAGTNTLVIKDTDGTEVVNYSPFGAPQELTLPGAHESVVKITSSTFVSGFIAQNIYDELVKTISDGKIVIILSGAGSTSSYWYLAGQGAFGYRFVNINNEAISSAAIVSTYPDENGNHSVTFVQDNPTDESYIKILDGDTNWLSTIMTKYPNIDSWSSPEYAKGIYCAGSNNALYKATINGSDGLQGCNCNPCGVNIILDLNLKSDEARNVSIDFSDSMYSVPCDTKETALSCVPSRNYISIFTIVPTASGNFHWSAPFARPIMKNGDSFVAADNYDYQINTVQTADNLWIAYATAQVQVNIIGDHYTVSQRSA